MKKPYGNLLLCKLIKNVSLKKESLEGRYSVCLDKAVPESQVLLNKISSARYGTPYECWLERHQRTTKTIQAFGCLPELVDKTSLLQTLDAFIVSCRETKL